MYYALSIVTGIIISIMIVMNGQLSDKYSPYVATTMVHLIGMIFLIFVMVIKREKMKWRKVAPSWMYLGGIVGVATIVFQNLSFGGISVSGIIALGLLGQTITSIIIDHFGFFKMPKHPFQKPQMIGFIIILLGSILLMVPLEVHNWLAPLLSLLSGVSIVVARTLNAKLSEKIGMQSSTMFNFIGGILLSGLLLLLIKPDFLTSFHFELTPNIFMYFGGIVGVIVIILSNVAVNKISSFYVTLFMFLGQLIAGIVLDILLVGTFSLQNLGGGIMVFAGLSINLYIEQKNYGRLIK